MARLWVAMRLNLLAKYIDRIERGHIVPNAPFQIPIKVLNQWRACSKLGKGEFKKWKQIFTKIPSKQKTEFNRRINGKIYFNIYATRLYYVLLIL